MKTKLKRNPIKWIPLFGISARKYKIPVHGLESFKTFSALIAGALVLMLIGPSSAGAWPFGKDKEKKPETPQAAPATLPMTAQTQFGPMQNAPQTGFVRASKAERELVLRSDYLTQAAFFNQQFEGDPGDTEAALYLSNALRALGRYQEAADFAHRALLFAPDNIDLLIAASRAHIAGNDAFYAIDPLNHVLGLKPKDWLAYSLIGVAYDQVKRYNDAQIAWTKALSLSPNNPQVLSNMAMSKAANGDLAGAESLLRTAVEQPGATLPIRQNLALVLGLQGKMAEAESLLRKDLPPQVADANLAWLEAQLPAAQITAPQTDTSSRNWNSVR